MDGKRELTTDGKRKKYKSFNVYISAANQPILEILNQPAFARRKSEIVVKALAQYFQLTGHLESRPIPPSQLREIKRAIIDTLGEVGVNAAPSTESHATEDADNGIFDQDFG